MHPKITWPKDLRSTLHYHERKVQKGLAQLLHAHSFFKPVEQLHFNEKMERFQALMARNENSKFKLIHISLNFHPSEKNRLINDFFIQLADEYMEKTGFKDQPYLVYRHDDSAHPHVHVLSTLIQEDGRRIHAYRMADRISKPVQKEMEETYGFISWEQTAKMNGLERQSRVPPPRIKYGQSSTFRSITQVLEAVIDQYKYTSLNELNGLLKQFNVRADRRKAEGIMYKNKGLKYQIIDERGKRIGMPINASAFYFKPTLAYLEKKFKENMLTREMDKKHLIVAIDWVLSKQPHSIDKLTKLLKTERIDIISCCNKEGQLSSLTYIDHAHKAVFLGSDLGKPYSAKQMQERLTTIERQDIFKLKMRRQHHNIVLEQPAILNSASSDQNSSADSHLAQRNSEISEQIRLQEDQDEMTVYRRKSNSKDNTNIGL